MYATYARFVSYKTVMRAKASLEELEEAARRELESLRGSSCDDSEWQEVRSKLIEFALILRSWARNLHLQ